MLHKEEVYHGVKLDRCPSANTAQSVSCYMKGIVVIEANICIADDSLCSFVIPGLNLE